MNDKKWSAGPLAVYALFIVTWLLIGLAAGGWFRAWPLALPLLAVALVATVLAWWRQPPLDRWTIAGLVVVGGLLYTPPAEHLPLFGDSAIYVNEAAYLARTGGLSGNYEPLAALSPDVRDPFYTSNSEQHPATPLQSYAGFIYGGYYITDPTGPTIQASRQPLSEVWLALWIKLVGVWGSLYNTPLWGVAGLVVLYLVARHFVTQPLALWAVLLLGVSYPQIHFSKAPYSEIPGQFWTLLGFYFALCWIERRRPWQLVTVLFCWVTAWSGRIDALLLLSGVGVLGLMAATWREGASLRWAVRVIPLCALLVWLAANGPYIGATYEIVALLWPWFGSALLTLLLALPLVVILFWFTGRWWQGWLQRLAPTLHLLLFAAALFVVGWSTLPNPWRVAEVTRRYQEIIWFSSYYLTPLFFWLALAGIGWLFRRGYGAKELLLLTLTLTLSALFLMNYTVAPVYPVALRRLISDVLPLLSVLAAMAVAAIALLPLGPLPLRRIGQAVVGLVALGWMGWLGWPVVWQEEGKGSLAFIQELHEALPPDGVFLFENQDDNSWIGWLAAPLYSLYGDWALRLDGDEPDLALLTQAIREFNAGGRTVYLVSQQNPPPATLLPPGVTATLVLERLWQSSLIGQTRAPYPPPYWEFAHPVYFFKIEE
ncbi:MAG: hypothetical protein DYG89_22450 [Caldilinea sp. CFX5]|nr:hypothetical protein [Caldilinea sp. CFX5]